MNNILAHVILLLHNVAQVLSYYWAKEHLPAPFGAPSDLIKITGVHVRVSEGTVCVCKYVYICV